MAQIGGQTLSLKGENPWAGMTTLSRGKPGEFELLENCYVNQDGTEIRLMPGLKTVLDAATNVRDPDDSATHLLGFTSNHVDARRPVFATLSGYDVQTTPTEDLVIWTRPSNLFCCEQVHGRWIFVGESDYRREPIYNAARTSFVWITAVTFVSGVATELTLSSAASVTANVFNTVQAGRHITVAGITGTAGTILNGKRWVVSALSGGNTIVTIVADLGSGANNVAGQVAFIDNVAPTTGSSAIVSDDQVSLTIWTSLNLGDTEAIPGQTVYPAHVANRQRDFGDITGTIKEGNQNAGTTIPQSRRRQLTLPYSPVPHLAGNRLLLAAPGYGCVFQCPVVLPVNFDGSTAGLGFSWLGNDIYDRPRALGVPKAIMLEDPDKTVGTTYHIFDAGANAAISFGGSNGAVSGRAGTYKFVVAYRDEATGELGLASEVLTLTTTTATFAFQGIRLEVMHPGYLLHESLALSVHLYRTTRNGEAFFFDRQIALREQVSEQASAKYGLFPRSAGTDYFFWALVGPLIYTDDAELATHPPLSLAIEQMPMGAKCARTIRGWSLFGGGLGDAGSKLELDEGTLSMRYARVASGVNTGYYNFDELSSRGPLNGAASPIYLDGQYGCAQRAIPPGYMGQKVASRTLVPFPRQILRLNLLRNTVAGWTGVSVDTFNDGFNDIRYAIQETPLNVETDYNNASFFGVQSFLLLMRGKLQASEQDNPGVTPSTSIVPVSNEYDEDIEGIGEHNGQAVICTRNKTFVLGFSVSPAAVSPEIAADKFGCIAAKSMVQFDGGCAWISERGPVALSGAGFQWIGQPLEGLFIGEGARYLRDSRGMMTHSWACHDAERGLLYFGLYANRNPFLTVTHKGVTATYANSTDEARSRFPCDEVLVYSYRAGAWSVWRPIAGMEIQWMTRGQDEDGTERVFVLGRDQRLYVLDDLYSWFNREAIKVLATASSTGTTISVAGAPFGQSVTDRGPDDNYVQAGMPVTVSRSSDLSWVATTTLVSFVPGVSITVSDPVNVTVGDLVHVGSRVARIISNAIAPKDSGQRSTVKQVGLRYMLWSREQAGLPSSVPQLAFCKAQVISGFRFLTEDGFQPPQTANLTRTDDDPDAYQSLGQTVGSENVQGSHFTRASNEGDNHKIELLIAAGAQVRLMDIEAQFA